MPVVFRLPYFETNMTLNTLMAILLLVVIFFTFFSVSFTLTGDLDPTGVNAKESCSMMHNDLTQDTERLVKPTREMVGDVKEWITA